MQHDDKDEQLLSVGEQCSHATCLLVDFLPFKCQHCEQPFCQEHFLAKAHHCPNYDETKYNRVAPHCPLCNEPVAIPPGQDPNIRMDVHLTKDCTVMTGRIKQKSVPTCEKVRCTKVLYQPIRCDKCRKQFCASHRFPSDHSCVPTPAASSSRLLNIPTVNTKGIAAKASVASQAVKKQIPTSIPKPTSTAVVAEPAKTSSSSRMPAVFSKTDKRARAERESRRRALQARARKGLLSDEERAILAAEEAAEANKKDDCVLM